MSEVITAIRRLDNRLAVSDPQFTPRVTTTHSSDAYVYKLDCDRDLLSGGYGIMKVSSLCEEPPATEQANSIDRVLYERYFITKGNHILPISKRTYRQGSWSELYLYLRTYNVLLSERGMSLAKSLVDHAPSRTRLEVVPCFLSDVAAEGLPHEHDPTDFDRLDALSLGGWLPASSLSKYMTNSNVGTFDAISPWNLYLPELVKSCETPLVSKLSRADREHLNQTFSSLLMDIPLFEYRVVCKPVGHDFVIDEAEFVCPITARLWGFKPADKTEYDPWFPPYFNKKCIDRVLDVLSELQSYLIQTGYDTKDISRVDIYRCVDDVVVIAVNAQADRSNRGPDTVICIDLAKCMIVNPSLSPLAW